MSSNLKTAILVEADRQQRIADLHRLFKPEPGQIIMGRQIFSAGTRRNWFQFGRDSGKSFGLAYCKVRYALTNSRKYCVSVFPERSQGQKTLWDSGYLRDKIPQKYWLNGNEEETFNKTELLIRLDNGSRMQIFGADSPDTILRGPKPDFCNFDEFRDFRLGVYDVMEANLMGKVLNIGSTPPDSEGEYTELMQMFKEEMKQPGSNFFFQELPTYVASSRYAPGGPLHEEIMAVKRRLYKRGEGAKWTREYDARFVPGGVGSVFKKYQSNKRHIERAPSFLTELIREKRHKLFWYCIADPSQNGCFAVLYCAIDKSAGHMYILGEEAVRDNADTGALDMWNLMKKGMMRFYPFPERWTTVYDEAAAWFYNDLVRHKAIREHNNVDATQKHLRDKKEDMSMLKDLFATRGRVFISRECESLIKEIENYVTNKSGEYHKDQSDDFIDCLRYLLAASEFEPLELTDEELEEELDELEPIGLAGRQEKRHAEEHLMTGEMDQLYPEESGDDGDTEFPYVEGADFD